jgi:hypothetical protein
LSENENEWQKTEPVPISIPRASRNFPDDKTRNKKSLIIGSFKKIQLFKVSILDHF